MFQRLTKLEEVYPGANILLFKQGQLPKVQYSNVYIQISICSNYLYKGSKIYMYVDIFNTVIFCILLKLKNMFILNNIHTCNSQIFSWIFNLMPLADLETNESAVSMVWNIVPNLEGSGAWASEQGREYLYYTQNIKYNHRNSWICGAVTSFSTWQSNSSGLMWLVIPLISNFKYDN